MTTLLGLLPGFILYGNYNVVSAKFIKYASLKYQTDSHYWITHASIMILFLLSIIKKKNITIADYCCCFEPNNVIRYMIIAMPCMKLSNSYEYYST